MMTFLENVKRYGGIMIVTAIILFISALVVLQLMAAAVVGFPKIWRSDPSSPTTPSEPSSRAECTIIEGIEICPETLKQDVTLVSFAPRAYNRFTNGSHGKTCLLHRANGEDPFGETRAQASLQAIKLVEIVGRALDYKTTFKVYGASFERSPIAYVWRPNGKPEIVYDRDFFGADPSRKRVSWAMAKVMAHEVAHDKLGHTIHDIGHSWAREASADYLSAMAVYDLGGRRIDALEITRHYGEGSESHPSRPIRGAVLSAGWSRAKARFENGEDVCKPKFLGTYFELNDQTCLMVESCQDDSTPIKLTCENAHGAWLWL